MFAGDTRKTAIAVMMGLLPPPLGFEHLAPSLIQPPDVEPYTMPTVEFEITRPEVSATSSLNSFMAAGLSPLSILLVIGAVLALLKIKR